MIVTICDEKGSTGPYHSVPMSDNLDDAIAGLVSMYSHLLRQLEGHRVVYRADIETVIREGKVGDIELSKGKIASAMSAHMYKVVGLEQRSKKWNLFLHCKKGKVVFTQFGYLSFLLSACIVKHSGVPLPALDSK